MYEFTPADPALNRPGHETGLSEKRKILLIYIPLAAFASMMTGIVLGENQQTARLVQLVFGFVINVLALVWAKFDADERQYALSRFFPAAVLVFSVLAIVYYLIRSRGARGGLISTGLLISYIAGVMFALIVVGSIVTVLMVAAGLLTEKVLDGS